MTRRIKVKLSLPIWLLLTILVLGACDRIELAPEDLDVTPTLTPTPLPTPTATPENGASDNSGELPPEELSEIQMRLDAILAVIPNRVSAGAVQWSRSASPNNADVFIEDLPRTENGKGFKVFFSEQIGGKANISYAVFDSPEDAAAHYEFIRGLRSVLETGKPDDTLPQPNLLGAGLYGSDAIFQQDIYFVEVLVEAFSSTSGNPLVPLSREAMKILEAGVTSFNTPDEKSARIDALVAVMPDELLADDILWQRETVDITVLEDQFENGLGALTHYRTEDGSEAEITIVVFSTPEEMQAAYTAQLAQRRTNTLAYNLSQGTEIEGLPVPNQSNSGTLHGESVIFQTSERYFIDINLTTTSEDGLLQPLALAVQSVLEESIAVFDSGTE